MVRAATPHRSRRTTARTHAAPQRKDGPNLYNDRRWRKARLAFLQQPDNALCRDCKAHGRIEPSTDVHHNPPHCDDVVKFWDSTTWVGLCHRCHSRRTAGGENKSSARGRAGQKSGGFRA